MLSGFGFINFICPKNMQAIAENVCEFEFQRKAVTIFRGANVKETVNHFEWKEKSQNYVRKFYTKGGRFVEAILIPKFTKKGEPHEMLWNEVINLETLRHWCSMSYSPLGIIIPNYNIVDHFSFYGISKSHLQKVLDIKSIHDNNNRLLIFNASCKVLVTIRVASETHLKEEISHCITDINMLLLMFRDELKSSGVVVTGLVVSLGKNLHLEINCTNCQNFIVTKEEFESAGNINNFWKKYKEKNIFNKIKTSLPEGDKEKEFMAVTSKILPYLASYQYQVCNTQYLPTLQKDVTKNILQAELLLDRYQVEIAHSLENHIILKGDYGTGKTIICIKKIEILSTVLRDREKIYYINFQGKSDLDRIISNKIKGFHQNIKVLKGDATLSNIIELKILPTEEKAGTKKVHLFVDEYNTESLTKREVNTLVKLFSEKEHFKKSKIVLAIQPLEMKRTDLYYIHDEESEYSESGNKLHELEKIMTVKCLHHVMRTTVKINSLIKITQEYLNEKSNHYIRNVGSSEQKDEVSQNTDVIIRENLIEDDSATVLFNSEVNICKDGFLAGDSKQQVASSEHGCAASVNTLISLSREPSNISSEVTNHKNEFLTGDLKSHITIPEHGSAASKNTQTGLSQESSNNSSDVSNRKNEFLSGNSRSQITTPKHASAASEDTQTDVTREASNSNSSVTQYQYAETVDFDELHKLTFTDAVDSGNNCQKRVTTYRYYFQSSIGHNISGPLPNLINLTDRNQSEVFKLFASLFQLIEIKAKKTVVIHFERDNPHWLINLFKLLTFPSLTIMDDVENFLSNENDRVVLVKNYNYVRGIEFSDVILLLDANEYHLKQFIPEAMARCQSNLSIVVKPAENGIVSTEAVMDLIEYWMKVNLEEEKKFINILELHFCECTSAFRCSRKVDHENLHCEKTREGYGTTRYEVHKNSPSYKKMSEEIEQKILSSTSLDLSGKREALKR